MALETDGLESVDARFPGRQGRLLFAYLAVAQGRPVPRDELAEALWGEELPATWDKALTVLVSKLRGLLAEHGIEGASALAAAFGCYRLQLPEGSWIDVVVAVNAAQEADEALAACDVAKAKAAALLAASLTLPVFLPGDDGGWVEEKRRELADVRSRALAVLAEACLRSGDAADAVKWAEQAIVLEPFRESGYRTLMGAHVSAGNRAEALRVYERCRQLLAEELGTFPSPETESIYRGLLEAPPASAQPTPHETTAPAVASPPPAKRGPERLRGSRVASGKRLAVAALTLGVTAILVTTLVTALVTRKDSRRVTVSANSIVAVTASGSITTTVPVGARPVAIASAAGALWVANLDDQSVTRVDLSSHQAVRDLPIGGAPGALAATTSAVWVTDGTGRLSEIDPQYNQVTLIRQLAAPALSDRATTRPMLAAFGSIWIVNPDGYVTRVDPGNARQLGSVDVGNEPSAIAAGAGSVWVTNSADGTVTRIDPATLLTTTIPVGHGPAAITMNAAGAWIANAGDDTLVRIDTHTNAVGGTTRVGDGPAALLATPGALWVANTRGGTLMRLDPRSGNVNRTIRLGGTPDALASAAGRVWVAVAAATPRPTTSGGVARLTVQDDFVSLDPALAATSTTALAVSYTTCANLVTYPDRPAPAGSRIVPEVAEAIPTPTDGGRTYTFTIRSGFHFSPPSTDAVTAATFKSSIERVANPRLSSPVASEFSGVVGYRAYVTGKTPDLAGVTVRGATLTIRLAQPDGAFLANLAAGAACAIPPDTPAVPGGLNTIPSAGPYYITSYTPRRQLVLKRNPNYRGDRARHLDQIVFDIGIDPSRALAEIDAGTADYALDGLPREAGPTLDARYGPRSPAAKRGHQQYFISPANGMRLLHMNTSRPLFSSVRLRRAVNYAIDRAALVAQGRRFTEVNPFNAGEPTAAYLPPTTAGATDFRLYPVDGPDLRRAEALAGHIHATAIMYTANLAPWLQEAQIIRTDLEPLGIQVDVQKFPIDEFFARIVRRDEPFDLAVSGYGNGSTDPAQLFELFDGTTIGATGNDNVSHFDDPAFNHQLKAAAKLSGTQRYREFNRLELELERDLVPAAAFATDASRDFFSARIGCQTYQPVYGMDIAALCLRS